MELPAVAHKNQVQKKPQLPQAITAIEARREVEKITRISYFNFRFDSKINHVTKIHKFHQIKTSFTHKSFFINFNFCEFISFINSFILVELFLY